MDNAEIVARLEEVVKTLERERRRQARRIGYRKGVFNRYANSTHAAYFKKHVDDASAEYDAIVARIAAVRAAIERLS